MLSEYTQFDDYDEMPHLLESLTVSKPAFVGIEASTVQLHPHLRLDMPHIRPLIYGPPEQKVRLGQ